MTDGRATLQFKYQIINVIYDAAEEKFDIAAVILNSP